MTDSYPEYLDDAQTDALAAIDATADSIHKVGAMFDEPSRRHRALVASARRFARCAEVLADDARDLHTLDDVESELAATLSIRLSRLVVEKADMADRVED